MNSWTEELKFITQDGVTVNVGSNVHWVLTYTTDGRTEYLYDLTLGEGHKDLIYPESNYKIFALYDEAMKYVREKNMPKFVEGEWLYFHYPESGNTKIGIFRYSGKDASKSWLTTEGYVIDNDEIQIYASTNPKFIRNLIIDKYITKATPSQIQEILTKVALHKGFKKGVKYISPVFKYKETCDGVFEYYAALDTLSSNDATTQVYNKGKWAEIIKEDVPEYKIPYISTKVDETQAILTLHNGTFTSVTLEDKVVKINYTIK